MTVELIEITSVDAGAGSVRRGIGVAVGSEVEEAAAEADAPADGLAAALGVGDALRLPGFVEPVEPWYAAFDALLNVSRHEGLSMATPFSTDRSVT